MGAACVFHEEWDEPTGCEGFYVVDTDPAALKVARPLSDILPLSYRKRAVLKRP